MPGNGSPAGGEARAEKCGARLLCEPTTLAGVIAVLGYMGSSPAEDNFVKFAFADDGSPMFRAACAWPGVIADVLRRLTGVGDGDMPRTNGVLA
jgi:hypothetical protein